MEASQSSAWKTAWSDQQKLLRCSTPLGSGESGPDLLGAVSITLSWRLLLSVFSQTVPPLQMPSDFHHLTNSRSLSVLDPAAMPATWPHSFAAVTNYHTLDSLKTIQIYTLIVLEARCPKLPWANSRCGQDGLSLQVLGENLPLPGASRAVFLTVLSS